MKAGKKIDLLEQALDYVLTCSMIVAKEDETIANKFDTCGVPPPSAEVEAMMEASADRIKSKV